ncbi:LAMI_0H14730g1_1 [Lachancea mirantina]|uniref:LAMI_0H14730g1_1 n=1 Tax=Lachancea mirantina TaxID=1230905 RepID=A0A1G4KID6_9SACH|nr:LAMI_0H14730g1_1 [Lachancea mirantina]
MSFLAKLSQLKKNAVKPTSSGVSKENNRPKTDDYVRDNNSRLPANYVREEDPAVRRLKEIRRKEQIKKGEILKKPPKTSGASRKKKDEDMVMTETKFKKKPGESVRRKPQNVSPRLPLKKFSFEELMRQADKQAKDGQKVKNNGHNGAENTSTKKPGSQLHKPGFKQRRAQKPDKLLRKAVTPKKPPPPPSKVAITTSIAKPNEKLQKRLHALKEKRRANYGHGDGDEDEGLDDFIEDDEEVDYDREEIWAMFNKGGRKRQYAYSDDESDDMEANEWEILQEEEHASKMAKLEDKKEEAWLKEHEKLKKERLGKGR